MKKNPVIPIVVALVAIIVTAIVLANTFYREETDVERAKYAKIRYFDGSAEMIPVKKVTERNASFELETTAGDRIIVGTNNVIIIEEDADRE